MKFIFFLLLSIFIINVCSNLTFPPPPDPVKVKDYWYCLWKECSDKMCDDSDKACEDAITALTLCKTTQSYCVLWYKELADGAEYLTTNWY